MSFPYTFPFDFDIDAVSPVTSPAARLFQNVIHDPDLAALWVMNESTGMLKDRCTLNRWNTASLTGTPLYQQSIGNLPGLKFTRAWSQAFLLPTAALDYDRTTSFSIMAVIIPRTTASANQGAIIGKGDAAEPNWSFGVNLDSATMGLYFHMIFSTGGADRLIVRSNNATTPDATAKMVGVTYDGTSLAAGVLFYIDGVAVAVNTDFNTLASSILTVCPASIGRRGAPGYNQDYFWNGEIGFLAVFSAKKTAADFKRWASLAGFL